ncbi:hypothetical protein [Limnoglobus roseus]|uniref:hypothetical protein n=1 Tax=Limnoglobus roseus TaxID=2598579 RepID=UPI0011EAD61C|nr:hypothetical protein [Limnoglobus roseus]
MGGACVVGRPRGPAPPLTPGPAGGASVRAVPVDELVPAVLTWKQKEPRAFPSADSRLKSPNLGP